MKTANQESGIERESGSVSESTDAIPNPGSRYL